MRPLQASHYPVIPSSQWHYRRSSRNVGTDAPGSIGYCIPCTGYQASKPRSQPCGRAETGVAADLLLPRQYDVHGWPEQLQVSTFSEP